VTRMAAECAEAARSLGARATALREAHRHAEAELLQRAADVAGQP
jgi:hypothetical protein